MFELFQSFIKEKLNLKQGCRILLAVSGGVDSMVMMDLFSKAGYMTGVAHCNFMLRGAESVADAAFVKQHAKTAGVKSHFKKFKTELYASQKKISVQMAARQLRYCWFDELIKKHQYDFVATAHHQTDMLETLLINQLRGTGLQGMHGILPVNEKVIRPLLFASQDDIISYAKQNKLKWRTDSSNADDKYVRNKIRHHILPLLKEINPSVEKTFAANAGRFLQAQLLLESMLPFIKKQYISIKKNSFHISISRLLSHAQPRALLYYLLRDFNFKNNLIEVIFEGLTRLSGRQFYSPTHCLLRNRNALIITPALPLMGTAPLIHAIQAGDDGFTGSDFSITIKRAAMPGDKKIIFKNAAHVACFDADKITFPLRLRRWQRGDFFYPLGMNGRRKKLSDFFINEKLSLLEKQHIWLLLSGEDICWITGRRMDERFKVTPRTKEILKLTFTGLPS